MVRHAKDKAASEAGRRDNEASLVGEDVQRVEDIDVDSAESGVGHVL